MMMRNNRKMSKSDMIDKYKELKEVLGRVPNSRDITKYSKEGICYSMNAYTLHFGSLYNLQIECGFEPTVIGRNKSRDELINDLKWLKTTLGRVPHQHDLKQYSNVACINRYKYVFGTFTNALKASGLVSTKYKTLVTKKGTKCRSHLEYKFATMLESKNIEFLKDVYYKNYIQDFSERYTFDFVVNINGQNVFIEIFGISGNEKYNERKLHKIKLCKENNIKLIEFSSDDFWSNTQDNLYLELISRI